MAALRILLLGGTTESAALAALLAGDARFAATLSLAGRTRTPRPQPLPTRIGGFGGAEALARYLHAERIDALVDATHPFAAIMSRNAAAAAEMAGVALLALRRPAWQPQAADRWICVPDMPAAAAALGAAPRRVLLTVGRQDLAAFVVAPQHHYVVRSVDPPTPDSLPPGAETLLARGPFELEEERALLRHHRIDVIVSKNSGGSATQAKLAAARELGLEIVMVERPVKPAAPTVGNVEAAFEWLAARHARSSST